MLHLGEKKLSHTARIAFADHDGNEQQESKALVLHVFGSHPIPKYISSQKSLLPPP